MKRQRRPWLAGGALFDYLDIQRWQVYVFMLVMWGCGFVMGLAW